MYNGCVCEGGDIHVSGLFVLLIIIFGFRAIKSVFSTLSKEGLSGLFKRPGLLILAFILLGSTGLLPVAIIGSIIAAAVKNDSKNKNKRTRNTTTYRQVNNQYTYTSPQNNAQNGVFQGNSYYTGYNNQSSPYANTSYQNAYSRPHSFGLPTSAKKRRRIVNRFNERYDLSLTDTEIDRIVDASFLSTDWAREVCYMNQKYDNIYSWFGTMNSWLKVYLHAFQVQTISSDFAMQERIAFDAFDQVFSDICSDPNLPLDVAIRKINDKYFTNFDETTFMIAYRFMESKGKRYTLSFNSVINNQADIDDLLKKYGHQQEPRPMR